MTDIIVKKGEPLPDMVNEFSSIYFEEEQLMFSMYRGSIILTILDNALNPGQVCPRFSFHSACGKVANCINVLNKAAGGYTPKHLRDYTGTLSFVSDRFGHMSLTLDDDVSATLSNPTSIRTYSPFALSRLKPLTEVPTKWTMSHVKRALANGQFVDLKCEGRYSDDYKYDSDSNFGRGVIQALPLLKDLIASPSGWWTNLAPENLRVAVCCHSFDNNSFVLKLEPDAPTPSQVA